MKNYQSNNNIRKKIIIISIIIIILAITVIIYNNLFIQEDTITGSNNNKEIVLFSQQETNPFSINTYSHMQCSDGIFYKRIYSYDEYLKETELWTSIVEMNETDFEDSFVLIMGGVNYETTGLYISNIYVENDKTCVDLKRKDEWAYEPPTGITAKISKELDRENIEIRNLPNIISTNGKYIELDEITSTYTIEQALNDGCFVVENYGNVISKNKNQLDEFIEAKENDVLRVCRYGPNYILLMDIQYDNDIVNINSRSINLEENKINPTLYFTGDAIIKNTHTEDGVQYTSYSCEIGAGEVGDVENICTIKTDI